MLWRCAIEPNRLFTPSIRSRIRLASLPLSFTSIEALGYDRYLKSNTASRRARSLFRQGCVPYDLVPAMPKLWLLPLIKRSAAMPTELPLFVDTFGTV
jgi:hypothetical protein